MSAVQTIYLLGSAAYFLVVCYLIKLLMKRYIWRNL